MYLRLQVLQKGFVSVFNPGDQLMASAAQATTWIVVRGQVGTYFWCSRLAGCDARLHAARLHAALLPLNCTCLQLCLEMLYAAVVARLCMQMCMQPFWGPFNGTLKRQAARDDLHCPNAGVASTSIEVPAKCCQCRICARLLARCFECPAALALGGSILCAGLSASKRRFAGVYLSGKQALP